MRYLQKEEETLARVEREGCAIAEGIHRSEQHEEAPPPPKKTKGLGSINAIHGFSGLPEPTLANH